MATGSGKGRGWMKLAKNKEVPRPGLEVKKIQEHQEVSKFDNLIKQLDVLSTTDDGILLNQKIVHIRDVFLEHCQNEQSIINFSAEVYEKCLINEEFIPKVVLLLSSTAFCNYQQNDEKYRFWITTFKRSFVCIMQEKFEGREVLRTTSPSKFFNNLKMWSSYFRSFRKNKTIINPEKFAITSYLETLLEHGEPLDIKFFSTIVCQHYDTLILLYQEEDEEFRSFLDKLKMKIISENKFTKDQKVLLFFMWDLMRHKFVIQPSEMSFYKSNLGEQDTKDVLMEYNNVVKQITQQSEVKTSTATSEEVNVQRLQESFKNQKLQQTAMNMGISRTNDMDKHEDFKKRSERPPEHNRGFMKWEQNFSSYSNDQAHREKVGRPILGIGARLMNNRTN